MSFNFKPSVSLLMTVLLCASVARESPAQEDSESPKRWAIAIHGGAGGAPDSWSEDKRQARRDGLEKALTIGRDMLSQGASSLDAVEAVIRSLEDNAVFNAGRGSVLTSEGKAELDASIMDGRTRACGAVAGVTTIKNPISTARLVMTDTKHVLLAGEGAEEFGESKGVDLVKPDYFLSFRKLQQQPEEEKKFGTVGCVALDMDGNLAAGTSTGGTSKKLPGRIGDSPIVGAGTFADNKTCAVSGTGVGEEYIRNAVAYDIAAQMAYAGRSLSSAVTEIMTEKLKPGVGGLISVSHDGEIVMQHNTPGMSCGAADSGGRFEFSLVLDQGGRADGNSEPESGDAENEIRKVIQEQAAAWNAGNLEGFMDGYWKSDQLTFSSGGDITRGWAPTLKRYQGRYPDRATMGKATFSDLELFRLDQEAYQVLGKWYLEREADSLGGRFTLIFRHFDEGWRIVHDHTSVKEEE